MRFLWRDRALEADHAPLAQALERCGAAAGHRVAVLAGNTPLAALVHAAALERGFATLPLDVRAPAPRLAARLASADAVVCTEEARTHLPTPFTGPRLVATAEGHVVQAVVGRIGEPRQAPSPVAEVESSGTSGEPKPVAITAAMLAAHRPAANERLTDGPDAVWLGVLPLHRIGGVAMVDRALANRSTLMLEPAFDAARVAHLLREGATHVSLVPTTLRRLLDAWGPRPPPSSLRCLLLGGDAAPEALVAPALRAGWPIHCTYGMTETCSQAATATPQERTDHPGTSGRALRGVSLRIEDGEIVVAGPTVARGGPLRTGDLGRLDGEGRLYVSGRADDRITTGGVKVHPEDVETVLRAHAGVADAAVVGVPDGEWGQRVVAFVLARHRVSGDDMRAWCKERLAAPQVPKAFHVVDALPRNESGKLLRAQLRRQATVPT